MTALISSTKVVISERRPPTGFGRELLDALCDI
jgi:hypothetical protein